MVELEPLETAIEQEVYWATRVGQHSLHIPIIILNYNNHGVIVMDKNTNYVFIREGNPGFLFSPWDSKIISR